MRMKPGITEKKHLRYFTLTPCLAFPIAALKIIQTDIMNPLSLPRLHFPPPEFKFPASLPSLWHLSSWTSYYIRWSGKWVDKVVGWRWWSCHLEVDPPASSNWFITFGCCVQRIESREELMKLRPSECIKMLSVYFCFWNLWSAQMLSFNMRCFCFLSVHETFVSLNDEWYVLQLSLLPKQDGERERRDTHSEWCSEHYHNQRERELWQCRHKLRESKLWSWLEWVPLATKEEKHN